jgi:hypothetical protein
MLSKLQKDQWLITDNNLNIVGMCDNTYYNNFSLSVRRDSWYATLGCLRNIYCEKLPKLVEKLIVSDIDNDSDIKRIDTLLVDSINGLKKINNLYKVADASVTEAHLDSIENEFANAIHEKIENYLNSDE